MTSTTDNIKYLVSTNTRTRYSHHFDEKRKIQKNYRSEAHQKDRERILESDQSLYKKPPKLAPRYLKIT